MTTRIHKTSEPEHSTDLEPITTAGRAAHMTAEIVDTALLAYAMCGSAATASERLKTLDPPIKVHEHTLHHWRKTLYPNRFRALVEKHATSIEAQVVTSVRGLALAASDAAHEAVALERTRIASGEVRDAAGSARNMATVLGIATDKLLLLQGRPTVISETRTADDVLRDLDATGRVSYVDSDAVEDLGEQRVGPTDVLAITREAGSGAGTGNGGAGAPPLGADDGSGQ